MKKTGTVSHRRMRSESPRIVVYFKSQDCETYESVSAHLKELVRLTLQGILEVELDICLRYPKHLLAIIVDSGNIETDIEDESLRTEHGEKWNWSAKQFIEQMQ